MPVAAIDYEVEYDNRARVPEHPEIFLRWVREAEDYRAETLKAGRAELGLPYGDTPRQSYRLVPAGGGRDGAACACSSMAAGGARSIPRCSARWRAAPMRAASRSPSSATICVPMSRLPTSSNRSTAPARCLWQRFGRRIFVCGHSAGGHLAGAMVATDWPQLYPKAPADLVPAGLFDLRRVRSGSAHRHQCQPGFAADHLRRRAKSRHCSGR